MELCPTTCKSYLRDGPPKVLCGKLWAGRQNMPYTSSIHPANKLSRGSSGRILSNVHLHIPVRSLLHIEEVLNRFLGLGVGLRWHAWPPYLCRMRYHHPPRTHGRCLAKFAGLLCRAGGMGLLFGFFFEGSPGGGGGNIWGFVIWRGSNLGV